MHGRNDPLDPDGTSRRPEPPTDDPAWLTDRPAPRSSYLFGDEPQSPSDGWYHDQPTEQWRPGAPHPYQASGPAYPAAEQDHYDAPATPHAAFRPETRWQSGEHYRAVEPGTGHYEPSAGGWPADEPTGPIGPDPDWTAQHGTDWTGRHAAPEPDRYDTDRYDTADQRYGGLDDARHGQYGLPDHDRYGDPDPDRHGQYGVPDHEWYGRDDRGGAARTGELGAGATGRQPSGRKRRPLVLGGAAAAATLVVSIGVAALALPGDGNRTDATAGEGPVATAPAVPEEEQDLTVDPLDSPSPSPTPTPSASPSTATPSAAPNRTSRPTPAPSRSTAASRQNADRQGSPSRGATATASPSSTGSTSQAAEVVELVNAERAKAGCGALSVDEKLMTAAQRHSQDQADHKNMSHTGSDGSDPGDRLGRVGYAWRTYGENVAWNQKTPAAVMDAWMNSDGHRANILNCGFTEIGVGVASSNGPYWTQVFAAPR